MAAASVVNAKASLPPLQDLTGKVEIHIECDPRDSSEFLSITVDKMRLLRPGFSYDSKEVEGVVAWKCTLSCLKAQFMPGTPVIQLTLSEGVLRQKVYVDMSRIAEIQGKRYATLLNYVPKFHTQQDAVEKCKPLIDRSITIVHSAFNAHGVVARGRDKGGAEFLFWSQPGTKVMHSCENWALTPLGQDAFLAVTDSNTLKYAVFPDQCFINNEPATALVIVSGGK